MPKFPFFSNAGELQKNSGNKGKFTGIPPLPTGIPLVPTGVPLRTDCIGVSFWIFEFVRYWAVYRPYRSVYRYRGSAVRHSGSVGRTLVVSILPTVFSQSSASNGSAAWVNTGGRWLMNSLCLFMGAYCYGC
jgi:hypothetical protein